MNLVFEYDSGSLGGTVYYYGINRTHSSEGEFYQYNGHGDVVQLTDVLGTIVQHYEYDAFGNEVEPSASDTNPFRYCGEYFDAESGTIYLRARYYDPAIGRFTQQDAWGHGDPGDPLSLNLYVYCYANPVLYIDISGNIPIGFILDIGGVLFSLGEFIYEPSLGNAGYIAFDVFAAIIPILPGSKVVKVADKVVDAIDAADDIKDTAKAVDKVNDASKVIKATDDVFKIALDTWQEAEDYVRVNNNAVKHKFSGLPIGYKDRIVDGYNRDKKIIYEVKYGRASLSEQIRSEIERDVYLRNNTDIESIEWHFFKSSKTGKGGQLVRYLKN